MLGSIYLIAKQNFRRVRIKIFVIMYSVLLWILLHNITKHINHKWSNNFNA